MKIKSLAAEARIIRQEERRHPGESPTRQSLHHHRVHLVRLESRASQLLYAYARWRHANAQGRSGNRWAYAAVESHVDPHCPVRRTAIAKATRMGERFDIDTGLMEEWIG